ncbi:MAG: hypothetical protein ACE5Q6_09085, partial [Dehalococcoidia bacterium]
MPDKHQSAPNDLWAITSYFNPMGYRRRWVNYHTFRRNLAVPLLTIELAYHDDFELRPGDATRLIQLRSDQVMWQKERLLNLALQQLPPECRKVAWLDCDILFDCNNWASLTSQALEAFTLVQPFSKAHYLNRSIDLSRPLVDQAYLERASFASTYVDGIVDLTDHSGSSQNYTSQGIKHDYSP